MSIIPIKLPPGFYANGTPYAGKGRWVGGDKVRWHDGSLRAIGGWERAKDPGFSNLPALYADADAEHCRDIHAWRTNAGDKITLFGTNKGLYHLNAAGTLASITVTGFPTDIPATAGSFSSGYGVGPYSSESYGTPRSAGYSLLSPAYRWDFDTWGEDLLACPKFYTYTTPTTLGLWSWSPGDTTASLVPNAPTAITGMVVTDQRMVMTIGSEANPRLVQWSDRENREVWNELTTNTAGKYTLQGDGALTGIVKVLDHVLILSETDAHVARFTGAPYVYGFERVGTHCGAIHPASVIATERFAIWPGRRNFFIYDGVLRAIDCDIMDYLIRDENGFNPDLYSVIHAVDMREFNEVWWLYAPASSSLSQTPSELTDSMRYMYFDYAKNEWGFGALGRCASFNSDSADPVIMVDSSGAIWNHELEGVEVTGQPYADTGPIEIGSGDFDLAVRRILPDTQTTDGVRFTLTGGQMPTVADSEKQTQTYDGATPVQTRVMGREVAMRVFIDTARQEVGPTTRFDVAPMGVGRR